jgi:pimeloyl-ACP methyl ester carboxylesterase
MHRYILTLLLLTASGYYASAQVLKAGKTTTSYGHNASAGKYYNIRNFRMYCEEYGSGTPILLIHGNGRSIEDFRHQIPFFARTNRVIVADSRAQGRSADPSDSLTYKMMAEDFNALLEAKHLDSVQVIGWSDGGIIGLLLAIRHPDKVKKLAISGANLAPDTFAINAELLNLVKADYNDLLSKQTKTAEDRNDLKLMRILVEEPNIPVSALESIKCPTLVIGGDQDLINLQHTVLISRHIPRSYLWIIPGTGHSGAISRKDAFNSTIKDFFVKPYRRLSTTESIFN